MINRPKNNSGPTVNTKAIHIACTQLFFGLFSSSSQVSPGFSKHGSQALKRNAEQTITITEPSHFVHGIGSY
jgi:hypothetical protein